MVSVWPWIIAPNQDLFYTATQEPARNALVPSIHMHDFSGQVARVLLVSHSQISSTRKTYISSGKDLLCGVIKIKYTLLFALHENCFSTFLICLSVI